MKLRPANAMRKQFAPRDNAAESKRLAVRHVRHTTRQSLVNLVRGGPAALRELE